MTRGHSFKNKGEVEFSPRGATLIEVLLSVALIAALALISAPLYQPLQTRNDLEIAVTTVGQTLRRAQILSEAVDDDISWGVKIQSPGLTLFKGVSFALRDANFDEIFEFSSAVTASGIDEVVFSKFSGLPQAVGTITLSTATESRILDINEKGTVSY